MLLEILMSLNFDRAFRAEEKTYTNEMLTVQRLLQSQQEVSGEEVVAELGIPSRHMSPFLQPSTALYAQLDPSPTFRLVQAHRYVAQKVLRTVMSRQRKCPVQRAIIYAVSLGGDTDTIAAMAGAISGALFGIDSLPDEWQKMCEAWEETRARGAALYARQEQTSR